MGSLSSQENLQVSLLPGNIPVLMLQVSFQTELVDSTVDRRFENSKKRKITKPNYLLGLKNNVPPPTSLTFLFIEGLQEKKKK
jgi:hypothetical protein